MTFSKLFACAALNTLLLTPVFAATSTLSSAEVGTLATIAVIDKNEILAGVVANNKNPSSGIADFAKMMIDQHGSNLTQLLEMADQFHVASLTGGESDQLASQGKVGLAKLAGLSGNDFAKAYVDAMVKGHEAALKLIDTKLMKTAKSEEIKKFVTDTRSAVVDHLDHAKKLQQEMSA